MLGRLTLPDIPGRHPVLLLVQTAEAQPKDGPLRNVRGERVPVCTMYRASLAPLGIGFFSYEGRGVSANAGGGPVIDRAVYAPMWELLSKLSMPIGLFHGELDANTPAADVRALEGKAKAAGKKNLEFHYFAELDPGLGTIEYFNTDKPSAGYAAIVEFMKRYQR